MAKKKKFSPEIQDLPEWIILLFYRPDLGKKKSLLLSDYRWKMNGFEFLVKGIMTGSCFSGLPADGAPGIMETDGASIPNNFKDRFGGGFEPVNLWPAVPHDGGYQNTIFIIIDGIETPCWFSPSEIDSIFKAIRGCDMVNGSKLSSRIMWRGIRLNSSILDFFRQLKTGARNYPTFESFLEIHPDGLKWGDVYEAA